MWTATFSRWWYGSATMMLLTSNLGSALQPHSSYEDRGLDVHRNLQDCSLCGTEVFTDGGETGCTVCSSVINECIESFADDPYGVVDVCTPCGSVSLSELEDFYTDLCGSLSDITKYTVENCWSYLVPACPVDSYEDPSDDYESPEDSSDDYESRDTTTDDDSTDFTTDDSVPIVTTDDGSFAIVTTDDEPLEQGSNNSSRGCTNRSIGAYLALAMFTVLLSTWMR